MAEGTGLENRHTGEPGIESSNLSLSVPRNSPGSPFLRDRRADQPLGFGSTNKETFVAGNSTRHPNSRAIHSIVAFE